MRAFLAASVAAGTEGALFHLKLDDGVLNATRLAAEAAQTLLDTGVDQKHPDLAGRVSQAVSFVPGETTDDGEVTLRPIECLGGCGWATVVSVDHHYRTHVKPEDVPAIVEELRSGE